MIASMFIRRWLLATLLVVAAAAVMIRLGIWQLDRLQQRRAFNARVLAQTTQPSLDLTGANLSEDLTGMEYRAVVVNGEYAESGEIALRNQYWNNEWGVHLITPLRILGSDQVVLVDRGWIPGADYQTGDWTKFAEPGQVTVQGVIRSSQSKAELGKRSDPTPAPGEPPLATWNFVNIPRLEEQIGAPLLPIYIQQAPDPSWIGLPHRSEPDLELTEGSHMSYAIQWFLFTAILVIGYPFYIQRQEQKRAVKKVIPARLNDPLVVPQVIVDQDKPS
jgi:surfeit locus 1 family protein